MRRYWALAAGLATVLLLAFALVEALGIPILVDPSFAMQRADAVAAAVGLALLVGDVVLPVPSSLIMIANGTLFGLGLGALLSTIGSLGAAAVGFWLGRRSDPIVTRVVTPDERARADRLLQRWGLIGIVITRPIPILAETTMILAGASKLRWLPAMLAALIGIVPFAVLYAILGVAAAEVLGP